MAGIDIRGFLVAMTQEPLKLSEALIPFIL